MIDLVFNELSATPPAVNRSAAYERMSQLVSVLVVAPSNGFGSGLLIPENFYILELEPEYRINDWLYDKKVPRAESSFFLSISTKSPFLVKAPEDVVERAELIDVFYNEVASDALRTAYVLDSPILSFNQEPWDASIIECRCEELSEDEKISTESFDLRNLSATQHFADHAAWITERQQRSITSMQDLLECRTDILPNLYFCPSVESQLKTVLSGNPHFQQIINKLFILEAYFAVWDEGAFDPAAFPKCNPASAETMKCYKNKYEFQTQDGHTATAHWHLYLTPDKGRLYFEADGAARMGIICYVGDKLPDVTYGQT